MFQFSFKRFLLLHLFIIIGVNYVDAKEIPTKSTLQVYDYAGILKSNELDILQRALKDWQDSTSIEMAVVIDKSLEDEDIFEYSLKIAQSWGIGDKSTNNGILLYISAEDKKIFMHIGPGLQGVIPDALGKRIIENILKPAFREQKYGEGIASAILTLQQLAAGTYKGGKNEGVDGAYGLFFLLFILIFVIAVFFFSVLPVVLIPIPGQVIIIHPAVCGFSQEVDLVPVQVVVMTMIQVVSISVGATLTEVELEEIGSTILKKYFPQL